MMEIAQIQIFLNIQEKDHTFQLLEIIIIYSMEVLKVILNNMKLTILKKVVIFSILLTHQRLNKKKQKQIQFMK